MLEEYGFRIFVEVLEQLLAVFIRCCAMDSSAMAAIPPLPCPPAPAPSEIIFASSEVLLPLSASDCAAAASEPPTVSTLWLIVVSAIERFLPVLAKLLPKMRSAKRAMEHKMPATRALSQMSFAFFCQNSFQKPVSPARAFLALASSACCFAISASRAASFAASCAFSSS